MNESNNTRPWLFLGIGGMGMAPLAILLARSGQKIVGHDNGLPEPVRALLVDAGVQLADFVFEEELDQFARLVYSSALRAEHPLICAAKAAGIETLRRGEMLAKVAADKRLIAVVGSHGKTTTTALMVSALAKAGVEVNSLIGGLRQDGLPPAHYADSPWLIAEIDESDGTIENFSPEVSLFVNLDWDHADFYPDETSLLSAFSRLAKRTKRVVLLPGSCPQIEAGAAQGSVACVSFSPSDIEDESTMVVPLPGGGEQRFEGLPVEAFNRKNAFAAANALLSVGFKLPADAFSAFFGVLRRQTQRYKDAEQVVIEDYAHHPSELKVLIAHLRAAYAGARLVVIFQPHRFSRTKQFASAFSEELRAADAVYLLPVYAAHESFLDEGTSEAVLAPISDRAQALASGWSGLSALHAEKFQAKQAGSARVVYAFIGAGDVEQTASLFAAACACDGDRAAAWEFYLKPRLSPSTVLKAEEPLAKKTTIRVGGDSRFYAEPASVPDLRTLLRAAALFEIPHRFIGRGSNLIVPDEGFFGIVVRLNAEIWQSVRILKPDRIFVGAGLRLKALCGKAATADLSGFEFLEGIPGSVGGSLRMNAGAMGNWIFDVVESVIYLDEDGLLKRVSADAFHVGYRQVQELVSGVALGAIFRPVGVTDSQKIRGQMDTYAQSRKESQPREPSAGCIFKNPEGGHAGKLIDESGLKGLVEGGAKVSEVHANFIVNTGGATSADIIRLVHKVREKVAERTGISLEPEVLLLGDSWESCFERLDAHLEKRSTL